MPATHNTESMSARLERVILEAPLNAIQEIIGAIHQGQTEVTRFALIGHDLYVFLVRHSSFRAAEGVQHAPSPSPSPSPPSRRWTPSVLPGAEHKLMEDIIDCACQVAKISRSQISSKERSKGVSLARALIVHHAPLAKVATHAEIASMMNLKPNSLYVKLRNYRKSHSKYFKKSVDPFLALRRAPTAEERSHGNGKGNGPTGFAASDAELGQRIATALPSK